MAEAHFVRKISPRLAIERRTVIGAHLDRNAKKRESLVQFGFDIAEGGVGDRYDHRIARIVVMNDE